MARGSGFFIAEKSIGSTRHSFGEGQVQIACEHYLEGIIASSKETIAILRVGDAC